MKKKIVLGMALVCILMLSGCYRTLYRGPDLSFPVEMNKPQAGEVVVDHFEEEVWNHYFIRGLFPTSTPDMQQLVEKHVPAGHEVRNLTIKHRVSFVNGLISFVADGYYSPMTTTISGDVVKVSKEAL